MRKTFQYRLYPTKQQEEILNSSIEVCRHLYNNCLGERIDAYKDKKSINSYDQINSLPILKESENLDNFNINNIYSQVLQDVINRLQKSYNNFFRRVKEGNKKPGFPRFKGINSYNSITYPQGGWKIKNGRLELSKIGKIKIKLHRELQGIPKTCNICRKANQWHVNIICDDISTNPFPKTGKEVGIDMGITKFATFSDDTSSIENPRILQKTLKQLRIKQRELERRSKKDNNKKILSNQSKNRTKSKNSVAKLHQKVSNIRKDFHYKTVKKILTEFDVISIEKLNVANMIQNKKLAKYIADVGWSQFINILKFKAESAVKDVIEVNPKYTSQKCHKCGYTDKNNRLTQAIFCCQKCGNIDNADKNAAKNIKIGQVLPLVDKVMPLILRSNSSCQVYA